MTELPLDAYYDLTEIGDVAISPAGDRVAYTATENDQEAEEAIQSVFVVPTDGTRDPHRLTRVASASSPSWDPDGERLAILAARDEDVSRRVGWQERKKENGDGETDEDDDADTDDEGPNGNDDADTDDEGPNGNDDADTDDEGPNGNDDADTDDEGPNEDDDIDTNGVGSNENDEPKRQVWLFDMVRGGDAVQVTDREEGVQEFDWSPTGDRIVIAARDPTDEETEYLAQVRDDGPIETTRLQHKVDGTGWTDTVTSYLFVVDVETGDTERLDETYGGGALHDLMGLQPVWGETDRIAFTACRLENPDDTTVRDVYTIDPDGDDLERVTDGDRSCTRPTWRDDGTLAFVARDPEHWPKPAELLYHDGETITSLTGDLDRTIARTATIHWVEDAVFTTIGDAAQTRLIRATTDGTVDRCFPAQGRNRALLGLDVDDLGSTAVLRLSHPRDGLDLYAVAVDELATTDSATDGPADGANNGATDGTTDLAFDPPDPESLTRLTDVNASLRREYPMPAVRRVEWESAGWTIDGICYHDPDLDLEAGDHPLVVAIHGGPMSYDEPMFSFAHAALTSRGYVVLRPNYRGGTSRGRAFTEELYGRWGSVEVTDVVAGVESFVDRGWVDSDRVFGYGFSYGGITQGYLVTQTDVLTAAVPEHGIYDPGSSFGTDDSHNWFEAEFGLPWEAHDTYKEISAIRNAGEIETPLLVTAGGQDWRCPPSQSEILYVAARKQGVDAKLIVYPDEHHNVGDPDRAIHRLDAILEWYERHDPAVEVDAE